MLIGNVDRISREFVGGWAADDAAPDAVVEVTILVNGEQRAHVACNRPRPDLKKLGLLGDSAHGFRYQFSPPLSMESTHQVTVQFSTTGAALGEGMISASLQNKQLTPILITALGRSGTTLLMSKLINSPFIIAGELYPFELRLLSYYATAYYVLTSPADHTNSTHPDALEGSRSLVGSNPFFHKDYRPTFNNPDAFDSFFKTFVPSVISDAFRKIIDIYYKRLGDDRNRDDIRFFAEKSNNLHPWPRHFARVAFKSIREIVLLRDPRDLYCSHRNYFKSEKSAAFEDVIGACNSLVKMRTTATADMLFIRYEELLGESPSAYEGLSQFIGTEISPLDRTGKEQHLFKEHGTSASPSASIGRWKTDLTADEIATIERGCEAFLNIFGYETTIVRG